MRLVRLASDDDFDGWRRAARALRLAGVAPKDAAWSVGGDVDATFYDDRNPAWARRPSGMSEDGAFTVPARFLRLAEAVFRHRSPERFGVLYRLLWRLAKSPHLLDDLDDLDVRRAEVLAADVGNHRPAPGLPAAEGAKEADAMPTAISPRALRAAQRVVRDGAFGCDAPTSLEDVGAGVQACRRCDLWREATRGVAGEGPLKAPMMLVGEQPGDHEDLAGRPFVGPAGGVLDKALAEAGVPRAKTYVTNAVKHFKHELRGKRRLHKTPNAGEVEACRWWLDAERRIVRPRVVVALGATAALGVFGRPMPIAANRGKALQLTDQAQGVVTYHPSFLLRVPDPDARAKAYAAFVQDLRFAWELAGRR